MAQILQIEIWLEKYWSITKAPMVVNSKLSEPLKEMVRQKWVRQLAKECLKS